MQYRSNISITKTSEGFEKSYGPSYPIEDYQISDYSLQLGDDVYNIRCERLLHNKELQTIPEKTINELNSIIESLATANSSTNLIYLGLLITDIYIDKEKTGTYSTQNKGEYVNPILFKNTVIGRFGIFAESVFNKKADEHTSGDYDAEELMLSELTTKLLTTLTQNIDVKD